MFSWLDQWLRAAAPPLTDLLSLLPAELRVIIFKYLLIDDEPFLIRKKGSELQMGGETLQGESGVWAKRPISILATSRQYRREGLQILLESNTFLYLAPEVDFDISPYIGENYRLRYQTLPLDSLRFLRHLTVIVAPSSIYYGMQHDVEVLLFLDALFKHKSQLKSLLLCADLRTGGQYWDNWRVTRRRPLSEPVEDLGNIVPGAMRLFESGRIAQLLIGRVRRIKHESAVWTPEWDVKKRLDHLSYSKTLFSLHQQTQHRRGITVFGIDNWADGEDLKTDIQRICSTNPVSRRMGLEGAKLTCEDDGMTELDFHLAVDVVDKGKYDRIQEFMEAIQNAVSDLSTLLKSGDFIWNQVLALKALCNECDGDYWNKHSDTAVFYLYLEEDEYYALRRLRIWWHLWLAANDPNQLKITHYFVPIAAMEEARSHVRQILQELASACN